jgi:DNA-binding transcriptional regulator YdaS (Cro superfamily)
MTPLDVMTFFGTAENAATRLGVSRAAIYQWTKRKKIPQGQQARIQIKTRGKLRAKEQ